MTPALDTLNRSGLSMLASMGESQPLTNRATLAASIAKVNGWVDTARPVIRAMVELSDGENIAFEGLYHVEGRYTRDEARGYVDAARAGLFGMLDCIRDEALCDERRSTSFMVTDAEAEAADRFNDELDEAVISVADAVRKVRIELGAWVGLL